MIKAQEFYEKHSTIGTKFHRCNVEDTETGIRICHGDHNRNDACEWEYYDKREPEQLPDHVKEEMTKKERRLLRLIERTNGAEISKEAWPVAESLVEKGYIELGPARGPKQNYKRAKPFKL